MSIVALVIGPIGLIGVELAQILGASEVYAIDPVANRREHAAKLGAIALDPAPLPFSRELKAVVLPGYSKPAGPDQRLSLP